MPEFTREQLREFNKKHYGSVAARFAQSAEEMLIELERGGSSPVHNQVSQSGEAGRKGGPQNAELKVFLLRKMEEYNYTFRNTDDEDRRYKAFISYKALEKFLKDAKKANFIK